jgi:hypothetical protein
MVDLIMAQKLEEDLAKVEASISDLICADKFKVMADPTWDFGESLVTTEDIAEMVEAGFFKEGREKISPAGQTFTDLEEGYVVVFHDFFTYGLRLPPYGFLCQVLETFRLQLHHLTPNIILTLSKFCWACGSYGVVPHIDTFYTYYEL